jgi:hypothetical protein
MATNRNNVITYGLKGKIGNLVFRFWGKRLVVSASPDFSTVKWSKAQEENRMRFRQAMDWARQTLEDPDKRAYYCKKAKITQTPWNLAVADYLKNLRVMPPDLSQYRGQVGDTIAIKPYNSLKVTAIMVTIFDVEGAPVEQGPAVASGKHFSRVYRAGVANPSFNRGHLMVTVSNPVASISEYFPLGD